MNITVLNVLQEESVFQIVSVLMDNLTKETILHNVLIVILNVSHVILILIIVTHVLTPDFQKSQNAHVSIINI